MHYDRKIWGGGADFIYLASCTGWSIPLRMKFNQKILKNWLFAVN